MRMTVLPMDVSVLQGKDGKGKDGKGKDGKTKDSKEKAKAKDDKDKTDSKSKDHRDKNCFYCDKIGHVKADCRKKKTTLAQNSVTSSAATSPPGLTNAPTNTSGASASSLRQLTVPSHVSYNEFHSPMRLFALKAGSPLWCSTQRLSI